MINGIKPTIGNTTKTQKTSTKNGLSFDNAMNSLNNSGLRNELEKQVFKNKIPILGICVGFQMMLESSEEGKLSGLGWIRGKVKKFSQRNLGSGSPDLPNFLDK